MTGGLRVPVALVRRPGAVPREVRTTAVLEGLRIGAVGVDGGSVDVDFEVGASGADIVASGLVEIDWTGECRRCLEPVSGHLRIDVHEVFRPEGPRRSDDMDAGDTYPVESENGEEYIDLGDVARDVVLLALPLSPLCRGDCAGPDPERFPSTRAEDVETGEGHAETEGDPRWAALDVLREVGDDG